MKKQKSEEKIKPKRSPKGYFLPGNQESVGVPNKFRPCTYCQRRDEVSKIVTLYTVYCNGELPGSTAIVTPYREELCLRLGIHTDTLDDWTTEGKCKQGDHSDLIRTIKVLMMTQKLRLLQSLKSNNPTGSIFQLKANHGMMETEKKILAGSSKEPLEIVITEETIAERLDNE